MFFMSHCFLFDYLFFFIWLYFSLLFGPSVHCSIFHKVELKYGLLEESMGEWTAWWLKSLQWRHNEGHGVSNHRYLVCLLPFVQAHIRENIIHLCNWPLSGDTPPPQRASNAEKVSLWWRHHSLVRWWLACCMWMADRFDATRLWSIFIFVI